jgi:hypothetical protein
LGISGIKIKRELMENINDLPDIYDKIAKKTKALDNVVAFYTAFVEFTLGHQHNGGCVPMIKYVIGNDHIKGIIIISTSDFHEYYITF